MDRAQGYLILAGILSGTIIIGGQLFTNLGLSLFEMALYRATFMALIFIAMVLPTLRLLPDKASLPFFITLGLVGALIEATQFGGVVLGVPVAIAAFLLYTQPIWCVLLGKLLLNEKITIAKLGAVALSVIGAAVLLEVWAAGKLDPAGIICSLFAGFMLALYVVMSRMSGAEKRNPLTTAVGCQIFLLLWLALMLPALALAFPSPLTRLSIAFPGEYWLYLLVFAAVSGVTTNLLIYRGLQQVEASTAGVLLLLEPVSAALLAVLLFGQPLGPNVLVGGALILASNYLVLRE